MMPTRYPAHGASSLMSDVEKLDHWRRITDEYAHCLIEEISPDHPELLHEELQNLKTPSPAAVATRERDTGHDVVAFLDLYTLKMSEELKSYIHVGLTSSDLVEYGLFQMVRDHANYLGAGVAHLLDKGINRWGGGDADTIRPGRTHGQIADVTSWGYQMEVIATSMRAVRNDLWREADDLKIVKSPGPTGWPGANPDLHTRGKRVADLLKCDLVPATQVVHRERLLRWACVYLRLAVVLENLALQVRLAARADVAEVREGVSRVGSSSMPHKQNPIDSEKVCGMAKVARGYFAAIAEDVALWEDRDLSNSSLERIAVPGLAGTVEHMLNTMIEVMDVLEIDHQRMEGNARDPRTYTATMQAVAQEQFGLGPIEASALIREGIREYPDMPGAWMGATMNVIDVHGWDLVDWHDEVQRRIAARFVQAGPPATGSEPGVLNEARPHGGA